MKLDKIGVPIAGFHPFWASHLSMTDYYVLHVFVICAS